MVRARPTTDRAALLPDHIGSGLGMAVAVVTDSTAYLPAEVIERHGIHVVPLYIVFGGDRTVRETDITDYPAFFEELRGAESLPTTSQPSGGALVPSTSPCSPRART